ncbi:hypothetical protein GCM10020229_53690 [Kitasatospora albolonga]
MEGEVDGFVVEGGGAGDGHRLGGDGGDGEDVVAVGEAAALHRAAVDEEPTGARGRGEDLGGGGGGEEVEEEGGRVGGEGNAEVGRGGRGGW